MILAGDKVKYWSNNELAWGRVQEALGDRFLVYQDKPFGFMYCMDPRPVWIDKKDIMVHKVDWVSRAGHVLVQMIQRKQEKNNG